MLLTITACSGGIEDKIPGTYMTGWHSTIEFFSDGTYVEQGEYGTGKWTLLDGNVLKLTNFYGESVTHELEDVTSEGIIFKTGGSWTREK